MFNEALLSLHQKTIEGLGSIMERVPSFAIGLILFFLFLFISRGFRKILDRALIRTQTPIAVRNLLTRILKFLLILIGLMVALSVMGLDKAVGSVLAGAGVAGLALGIAFRDIAMNFIAGVALAFNKHTEVGDLVKIQDYMGVIKSTNFRETTIILISGEILILPNKIIFDSPLINLTDSDSRRIDLPGSVSYSDDLDKTEEVVRRTLAEIPHLDPEKNIDIFFEKFADSSIEYTAYIWVAKEQASEYLKIKSEAIKKIKKAFESEGITIPFPTRTIEASTLVTPSKES